MVVKNTAGKHNSRTRRSAKTGLLRNNGNCSHGGNHSESSTFPYRDTEWDRDGGVQVTGNCVAYRMDHLSKRSSLNKPFEVIIPERIEWNSLVQGINRSVHRMLTVLVLKSALKCMVVGTQVSVFQVEVCDNFHSNGAEGFKSGSVVKTCVRLATDWRTGIA